MNTGISAEPPGVQGFLKRWVFSNNYALIWRRESPPNTIAITYVFALNQYVPTFVPTSVRRFPPIAPLMLDTIPRQLTNVRAAKN
jgi:hypothetical protein